MKEVILTSANLYLVPGEPPDGGELRPMVELILVTSEPRYAGDEGGQIVRSRTTETLRVHTTPEGLRLIAKQCEEAAKLAEKLAERAAGLKEKPPKKKATPPPDASADPSI